MHASRNTQQDFSRVDKKVTLKKDLSCPHVHHYTLKLKIIKARSDEDEQQVIQDSLQKFLDIILQGDSKDYHPSLFGVR
jgi:hypothetical protein